MKPLVLISFLFCATAFGSAVSTNLISGHVRLAWTYDTSAEPISSNLAFNVYGSTNLATPVAQWPCLTNLPSPAAGVDWTGTNFYTDLSLSPAQYFFVMTASNFWGECSITSNMVSTPPPAQVINNSVRIQKLP